MTVELLNQRIKEIETEKIMHGQMIFTLDGALQDCLYWLEQLTKPVEPVKPVEEKPKE